MEKLKNIIRIYIDTVVDFPNAEKQDMNGNDFAKVNILCIFI